MTYLKLNLLNIILIPLALLCYSCGDNPVIPDPYAPNDYLTDLPKTPFDSVQTKSTENELTFMTWTSQDNLWIYQDFVDIFIIPNFETRGKVMLSPQFTINQEEITEENLVQCAIVFGPESYKVYSNGEKSYEEAVEFSYDRSSQESYVDGFEFDLQLLNDLPNYGDSRIYSYALSSQELVASHNSTLAEQSMVTKYDFESNSDTETVESINEYNGQFKGDIKIITGDNNKSALFRKDGDYIVVPHNDNLSFAEEFSVALWVYPDYSNSKTLQIIDKGANSNDNYELYAVQGELSFSYLDKNSNKKKYLTSSGLNLEEKEWTQIGVTVNQNGIAFYSNGNKVYEKNTPISLTQNSDDIFIGRRNQSSNVRNFHGGMDDITFYIRALTETEMSAVYNAYLIK